ncbi:hypothetical protein AB5N19_01632 [Seiridium cardinale]
MWSNVVALLPLVAAALASPLAKPVRHRMNIPAAVSGFTRLKKQTLGKDATQEYGNRADEDVIQEYNKRADEDPIREYGRRRVAADEDAMQEYSKRADEDAVQEYNKRLGSR